MAASYCDLRALSYVDLLQCLQLFPKMRAVVLQSIAAVVRRRKRTQRLHSQPVSRKNRPSRRGHVARQPSRRHRSAHRTGSSSGGGRETPMGGKLALHRSRSSGSRSARSGQQAGDRGAGSDAVDATGPAGARQPFAAAAPEVLDEK